MRYQHQIDENDCGPACISMIASHYKSYISLGKIKVLCRTDTAGTNLAGMVRAAEKLGFVPKPVKGGVKNATLDQNVILPFIAHVKLPQPDNKFLDHYIVVQKITSHKLVVWDPDLSRGKHSISRLEFLKYWTGYALLLYPDAHFTPRREHRSNFIKLLPLVLPHRESLLIISLSSGLLMFFGIIISYYYKYIIDEVIISKASFTLTAFSIGVMLMVATQSTVEALRGILINFIVFKMDVQLKFSYVTHILKLPISFFDSRKTGDVLSRLTDVSRIREMLSATILSLIFDCVLIMCIGPILFNIHATLFAISFGTIILLSSIVFIFTKLFRFHYGALRKDEAEVSSSLVELINGIYTIKALNAEEAACEKFEKKQMKVVWASWKISRLIITQKLCAGLVYGITGIVIFWVGSKGIINDTFSFGSLLSYNSLLVYFTGPLFRMMNAHPQIQEASIAAERVLEFFEMDVEQEGNQSSLKPSLIKGEIDFCNISFSYGTRPPIYRDLSFHINPGQWVAFVGPSGCGKTTLIKLLLKYYTPDQGTVLVDNHDLRDIDVIALRSRIGYVPQDIHLFSGTIAENIALHNPIAEFEDILIAAKKAGADDFIKNLPERYNTKISERGATLSGGERQRLAIARALLCKPDVIILDEATSNLDSVSEQNIHKVIDGLRGAITIIVIAHRISTVKNCDVIFVMDNGNIAERGNHEELLSKSNLYKKMWDKSTV